MHGPSKSQKRAKFGQKLHVTDSFEAIHSHKCFHECFLKVSHILVRYGPQNNPGQADFGLLRAILGQAFYKMLLAAGGMIRSFFCF